MDPEKFSKQFQQWDQDIYDWNEFARRQANPSRRERPLHNDPDIQRHAAEVAAGEDYFVDPESPWDEDYFDRLPRHPQEVAADWHGGQRSGLYSYASTGTVSPAALREVDHELAHNQNLEWQDREDLENLRYEIEGRLGRGEFDPTD